MPDLNVLAYLPEPVRRTKVVGNAAAVQPDIRCYDVQVGVAGVDVPVHEPGLVSEIDAFHELSGDVNHFFVRDLVAGMKIDRYVDAVHLAAFVQCREVLQALQFVFEAEVLFLLPIVVCVEEERFVLFDLLLVVAQGAPDGAGAFYDGNHFLAICSTVDLISAISTSRVWLLVRSAVSAS